MQPPTDPKKILLEQWLAMSETERPTYFVDCSAASQLVGVSQRTIRLWIDSGHIQAVQIGKKYQISIYSLKRFLLNNALRNQ